MAAVSNKSAAQAAVSRRDHRGSGTSGPRSDQPAIQVTKTRAAHAAMKNAGRGAPMRIGSQSASDVSA